MSDEYAGPLSRPNDEFAAALGRLCMAWSELEDGVRLAVLQLSSLELLRFNVMTIHINMKELLSMVQSLFDLSDVPWSHRDWRENEIRSIARRVNDKLSGKRNRYVHGKYAIRDNQLHRVSKTARQRLEIEFIPTGVEEVNTLIDEIETVRSRLRNALDIVYEPTPSQ